MIRDIQNMKQPISEHNIRVIIGTHTVGSAFNWKWITEDVNFSYQGNLSIIVKTNPINSD